MLLPRSEWSEFERTPGTHCAGVCGRIVALSLRRLFDPDHLVFLYSNLFAGDFFPFMSLVICVCVSEGCWPLQAALQQENQILAMNLLLPSKSTKSSKALRTSASRSGGIIGTLKSSVAGL